MQSSDKLLHEYGIEEMQPDWDSAKEKRRQQFATLLTLAGVDPGQPEIFRIDKAKGYTEDNAAIGRLDALLVVRDQDFLEEYADIIKQADALV